MWEELWEDRWNKYDQNTPYAYMRYLKNKKIFKKSQGTEEIVLLRVLNVLAEDPALVPSTHRVSHNNL